MLFLSSCAHSPSSHEKLPVTKDNSNLITKDLSNIGTKSVKKIAEKKDELKKNSDVKEKQQILFTDKKLTKKEHFMKDLKIDLEIKNADQIVKTTVTKILKILKDKNFTKEDKRKEITKVVDGIFDFNQIAHITLGKKTWSKLNQNEKNEFMGVFVTLLKNSYIDKIYLFSNETVEFQPSQRKKNKVHVPTLILSKDRRIQVVYKFYLKEKKWMVYDVEIEGVSLVRTYRMQYSQFLRKKTFEELLAQLKSKVLANQYISNK